MNALDDLLKRIDEYIASIEIRSDVTGEYGFMITEDKHGNVSVFKNTDNKRHIAEVLSSSTVLNVEEIIIEDMFLSNPSNFAYAHMLELTIQASKQKTYRLQVSVFLFVEFLRSVEKGKTPYDHIYIKNKSKFNFYYIDVICTPGDGFVVYAHVD